MKRLLLSLLVICTLTSSLAWAWDNHDQVIIGSLDNNHGFVFLDSDEPSDTSSQKCHYSSCGLAHVVGFLAMATLIIILPTDESFSATPAILISQNIVPPLKPPRS